MSKQTRKQSNTACPITIRFLTTPIIQCGAIHQKEAVEGEQTYARLVMHALNETGKLKYINPGYHKKMKEVIAYGR